MSCLWTETNFRAEMVAAKKALDAEKACIERLEHELVTEPEKRQQLLAKRRQTSQSSSRLLAEDKDPLQNLQL